TAAFPLRPARTVPRSTGGTDLLIALVRADLQLCFVVDERGGLVGRLEPETARRRLTAESLPQLMIAGDLAESHGVRVSIRATPSDARTLLHQSGAPSLPVVDDDGVLVGEVAAADVA